MVLLFRGFNSSEPNDYRLFRPSKNELSFARLWWESSDATFVVAPRLTDEDPLTGYPIAIPGGRFARTTVGTSSREVGGQWVLSWEGTGEVGVRNGANTQRNSGRYIEFTRDASTQVDVCIYSTTPGDLVRNIWVGEQRYHASRANGLMKPDWLAMLSGLNVTHPRFMQLQNTNTSTVTSWAGMRPDGYFTQSDIIADDSSWGRGASIGFLLAVAVESNAQSAWFCVPHAVDEGQAYVQWVHELLRYIRDWRHPHTGARFTGAIRLQYSNESWNSGLGPQHTYCRDRGVALGVDGSSPFEQGHQFYAVRSEQIFETALAARATLGLTNQIIRVLDEQAGAGGYLARYRTTINPRSGSPRSVAADEFTSACYYGHPDFERGDFYTLTGVSGTFQTGEIVSNGLGGGALRRGTFRFTESGQHFVELNLDPWTSLEVGQTMTGATSGATGTISASLPNRIGRIRIGDSNVGNPWLTPAAFVALTDTELAAQCQRDMDLRVFRPVTSYNEGAFPTNPTVYNGGILATMQYAGAVLGLRVTSYEGGCDHLNLPSASEDTARWTAAIARNVAWHRTLSAAQLHEQVIQRHVDAGVEGVWLFDEGTGWHGAYGCWSVYEDHRSGFAAEQRYLATQRAFAGGAPTIVAQYTLPVVVSRATRSTATIVNNTVIALSNAATVRTRLEQSTAVVAGFLAQSVPIRLTARVTPSDATLGPSSQIEAFSNAAIVRTRLDPSTATVTSPIFATSNPLRVFVCAVSSDAVVRDANRMIGVSNPASVRVRPTKSTARLTGADGTATSQVYRFFVGSKFFPRVDAPLPAGTFVWRGQALGWIGDLGLVRPLRAGDLFAGFAAEDVSGSMLDADGDTVLSTKQLRVTFMQRGDVTSIIDGTAPLVVGADVYALDDKGLTTVPNGSKVGRILRSAGRFATIYFEGVTIRLVDAQ